MYTRIDQLIIGATRTEPRMPARSPVPSMGLVSAALKRKKVLNARRANGEWTKITRYFVKDARGFGLADSGWVEVVEVSLG